jgi:hypothetical protein
MLCDMAVEHGHAGRLHQMLLALEMGAHAGFDLTEQSRQIGACCFSGTVEERPEMSMVLIHQGNSESEI